MNVNVFIQARMSSQRFPGKVLAPLHGKPLVMHLIERAQLACGVDKVVVLTSDEPSDAPLVAYLGSVGCPVFCGDLNNVFMRFHMALNKYPCDYFIRLSADSPLMDGQLLDDMVVYAREGTYDFISNVHTRRFPRGQSVEIVRSKTFLSVNAHSLNAEQQEHVMPYFYDAPVQKLFIDNVVNQRAINNCVDTIDDLQALESGAMKFDYQGSVRGI